MMKKSFASISVSFLFMVIGAAVLAGYQPGLEESRSLKSAEQDEVKKTAFRLAVGDNAWNHVTTALPALDGHDYSLEHWKGKVILINFWASWCAPCQYEIPKLVKMQNHYADKGLQVVGIGVDREMPLRNVSRSLGINYPVLIADDARGRALLERWGNEQQIVPYNVVIDKNGKISFLHLGQFDEEIFEDIVHPLLD